jgi:hypothetical protein
MAINLQAKYLESDKTFTRTIACDTAQKVISPRNAARRGGLIINNSTHDLFVWFGSNISASANDWIVIPSRCNCDIPLFFVGEIHGYWRSKDDRTAKIFEFYGD